MFDFLKTVWKSNWRNKATLIFGAFILVTAIAGVIYGAGCQG